MSDVFKINSIVESQLQEEATTVIPGLMTKELIQSCLDFAKAYLKLPEELPLHKQFWYSRGGVHRTDFIKNLSKTYIEPLLSRKDCILIGDTVFAITWPPHDIHVDCRDFRAEPEEWPGIISYKSVVIPLAVDTIRYPKFYTTDQYFYGPSTRFRQGAKHIDDVDPAAYKHKSNNVFFCYDYKKDGVKHLSETSISKEWYDAHIDVPDFTPHMTFNGFSIEREIDWKPGDIITFDSARIHFAENLTKAGGTHKIGISLNYGIRMK